MRTLSAFSATLPGVLSECALRKGRLGRPGRLVRPGPAGRSTGAWRAATALLMVAAWLSGCASETLFQSSFSSNAAGMPPAANQATGTIQSTGAPGSVLVVPAPPNASGQWAQISRKGEQAPISSMLCNFAALKGEGTYGLLAVMYIPSGSGLATVEFDTGLGSSPPSAGFLHIDFLQNNTLRINDDNAQMFGSFPRDQFFTLSVTLEITATAATAHLQVFGAGASGSRDVAVSPLSLARQIGAVRFWMGFPWNGSFDVTNILVTRRT